MSQPTSCDQKGVCQAKTPACSGCHWQLAPGVVDGPYISPKSLRIHALRMALLRCLLITVCLGMVCLVGGFGLGYSRLLELLP